MGDRAESSMVGIILMVALAVVLAGALYVFLSKSNADTPPPRAIGLSVPTSDAGAVTYTVSAVAQGAAWDRTRLILHDVSGAYSIAVTRGATTDTAASTDWVGDAYYAARTPMVGGDTIRLTAASPQGRVDLLVVDTSANAILLDVPVSRLG